MRLYSSAGIVVAGLISGCVGLSREPAAEWTLASPGSSVVVHVQLVPDEPGGEARLEYDVQCGGKQVLGPSPLGIVRQDQAFLSGLTLVSSEPTETVDRTYTLLHGKRKRCRDHYRELRLTLSNESGAPLGFVIRAYDDGVAFRYHFPDDSVETRTVLKETTGFQLPEGARIWAHPYDKSTEYSPAYETYYEVDVPAGTPCPHEEGWAFPVLFKAGAEGPWGLLTEAGVDRTYCGSRLAKEAPGGRYLLRFPDETEGNHLGAVTPSWKGSWQTPWRLVLAAESLEGIVESTLVTNVCPPSVVDDAGWIRPGRVSWSWLSDHDSPQDCEKLKSFVDLAAEMGWEYSLVDANWTIMKNGTIHDLLDYAKQKGVGLLLWYNSGGPHNYVSEKPRGAMFYRKIRQKELQRLKEWGVRGVKVDFFQSDKQDIMGLYQDILEDAAEHQILVNFHGCTLPRGWSRTYPHLMTMEAVRGAECYSFDRRFTKMAPVHNTTIPFTRNVVGPMDYTPVMFADNVYPHITTWAHELALPVVFESGWLHFADRVDAYTSLPEEPKDFLNRIPVAWDDTKLLAGMPSRYVVMARRSGGDWYIGGINGQEESTSVRLDLSRLGSGSFTGVLIEDGEDGRSFRSQRVTLTAGETLELQLQPRGGFVLRLTAE